MIPIAHPRPAIGYASASPLTTPRLPDGGSAGPAVGCGASHSALTTSLQSVLAPLHGAPPNSSGLSVGISQRCLPTHMAATAAVVLGEEHVGLVEKTPDVRFSLQRELGSTCGMGQPSLIFVAGYRLWKESFRWKESLL